MSFQKRTIKLCPGCGQVKTRQEFNIKRDDSISHFCKVCSGLQHKKYKKMMGRPIKFTRPKEKTERVGFGDACKIIEFLDKHIDNNNWNGVQIQDRPVFLRCSINKTDLWLVQDTEEFERLIKKVNIL